MPLSTLTVDLDNGRSVVVSEATALVSFKRRSITNKVFDELAEEPDVATDIAWTYATLVAPVTEWIGGEQISLEEFLNMREADLTRWQDAVKELNPHWFGLAPGAEKKV